MSYVPKEGLKGTEDTSVAYYTSDQAFTTSKIVIDFKTQFTAFARKFRIVNSDPTHSLTYKQGSPSGVSKTVPVSSEVVVTGWESYVEITPDGGTGVGYIEYDLVNIPDAYKK